MFIGNNYRLAELRLPLKKRPLCLTDTGNYSISKF